MEILSTVLALRRSIAKLLDYSSWCVTLVPNTLGFHLVILIIRADYITEVKMIKSADNVHKVISLPHSTAFSY